MPSVASYHAAPSTASLPVGIGRWHHLGQSTLLGQRVTPLRWETLKLGDAHSWRCPHLATPTPDDAQSGQHPHFPPLVGPTVCLTLVNARRRVGTKSFIVKSLVSFFESSFVLFLLVIFIKSFFISLNSNLV